MNKGFTLIEFLLYIGISVAVIGFMAGILYISSDIQNRSVAQTVVQEELNFTIQTINRLMRYSSNIEIATGTPTSTLKLRMKDLAKDPTCLTLESNVVKIAEGPAANKNNCTTTKSDLTSGRVKVDDLQFTKTSQYPGHDSVSVDIQMSFNTTQPKLKATLALQTAIMRVSAATFDSDILPGSAIYNLGQSGSPWKNLYLGSSGLLNLGTSATDPTCSQSGSIYYNTASSTFRGCKAFAWSDLGGVGWALSGNNIYNTNSGNVGIGTTGPGARLHVVSSAAGAESFRATDNSYSTFRIGHALRGGLGYVDFIDGGGTTWLSQTSGNVGIGTTGPGIATYSMPLTVESASSLGTFIGIRNTENTLGMGGVWMRPNTTNAGWLFGTDNSGQAIIKYGTAASEVDALTNAKDGTTGLTITTAGNVGIGTTGPNYKLDLNTGSLTDTSSINLGTHNTTGTAGGGIVWKSNYSGYTKESAAIKAISEDTSFRQGIGFFTGNNNDATTNAVERVRIDRNGNVGIGTTGPGSRLDVRGDAATELTVSGTTAARTTYAISGTPKLEVGYGPTAYGGTHNTGGYFMSADDITLGAYGGSPYVTVKATTGNVGIGTTGPKSMLSIVKGNELGLFSIRESSNLYGFDLGLDPTTGDGVWRRIVNDVATEAFRVQRTSGNVGIGTTGPGAKLHVVGDIIGSAQVFRAYMTANFAKAATWEKIPFNATLFNTLQGTFDTTNNRFTASRAGYYQISVTGYSSTVGTGSERYAIGAFKNGANEGFTGGNYSAGDTPLTGYAGIVYLNGSTDYVEIWMYSAIAATLVGGSSGGHVMFWYMNYLGT